MAAIDPYQAPATRIGPAVASATATRWASIRWFPAALCLIFALGAGLMAVVMFGMTMYALLLYGLWPFRWTAMHPARMIAQHLGSSALLGLGASFGVLGARSWMRRRWLRGVLGLVLCYVILIAGATLLGQTSPPRWPARP